MSIWCRITMWSFVKASFSRVWSTKLIVERHERQTFIVGITRSCTANVVLPIWLISAFSKLFNLFLQYYGGLTLYIEPVFMGTFLAAGDSWNRGKLLNLTFRRLTEANNWSAMDMEKTSSKRCRKARILGGEKRMLSEIITDEVDQSILLVHDQPKRNVCSKSCSRTRDSGELFANFFLLRRRNTFNNILL